MLRTAILTVAIALWATTALGGGCSVGDCATGAAGQGGIASDGKAQGFQIQLTPAGLPDQNVKNVGNKDAGHIDLTGPYNGTLSGTYRNDIGRGHETGYFGDGSGHL